MDDQPTEVDDDELLLVVLLARARFNGIHVVVAVPLPPDLVTALVARLTPFATISDSHDLVESSSDGEVDNPDADHEPQGDMESLDATELVSNANGILTFPNFTSLDTLKIAAVLLGFVVQLFAIGTTISLINNMAPPKRAS
ncbi:hypothetical protein HAX54_035672 [Datura stramonium]|uniref:Uncharacterized protein n=1 Tax=Datura stramonium TaxID=4076 RepID=A0ABS8VIX2_DATST|nr:hypothetical protein [Datura stramonium]